MARLNKVDLSLLNVEDGKTLETTPVEQTLSQREQELALKMVCLLIANGETEEAVHKKVGCDIAFIRKVKSSPRGIDLIIRMQHDTSTDMKSRVKKLASLALDAQARLLLSPTTPAPVLAKLSQDLIDRDQGKATQITETRTFNFDLKDAKKVDEGIKAAQERLARIQATKDRLALAQ